MIKRQVLYNSTYSSHIKKVFFGAYLLGVVNVSKPSEERSFDVILREAKEISAQAQAYISPELDGCKTLECISDLLYKEEDRAIDDIFEQKNISAVQRKLFHTRWPEEKKRQQDILKKGCVLRFPNLNHDKNLGDELLTQAKNVLEKYDIHANSVVLKQDCSFFYSHGGANAASSNYEKKTALRIFPTARISFCKSRVLDDDVLRLVSHEVTHVKELHTAKRKALLSVLQNADSPRRIPRFVYERDEKYIAWVRTQEKQAELFPLLNLEDPAIKYGLLGIYLLA